MLQLVVAVAVVVVAVLVGLVLRRRQEVAAPTQPAFGVPVLMARTVTKRPEGVTAGCAALVGTSDGRSGNLRGLDTLTNNFHYLNVHVLPLKVPISLINNLITNKELTDEGTIKTLERQADLFISY